MVKPEALLLLLTVAASQAAPSVSTGTSEGLYSISACPITYYGHTHYWVEVLFFPDSFAVCFKDDSNDLPQDCFVFGHRGALVEVTGMVVDDDTEPGSNIHNLLPHFTSTSDCYVLVELNDSDDISYVRVIFYNFGSQAALYISAFLANVFAEITVEALVGEEPVGSLTRFYSQSLSIYGDFSGCRYSDTLLFPSTGRLFPETCTTASCSGVAALSTFSICGPLEVCQGNNMCVPDTFVCTVTGSSVIDFHNRLHYIPDWCNYTLMDFDNNFHLAALFRDRRRIDVPFLDSLHLDGPDVEIGLYQGGRVLVNGETLTLNSTVQEFFGVELSKDSSSVTVGLPSSSMKIIFDGNTVHLSGNVVSRGGLCGNPTDYNYITTLGAERNIHWTGCMDLQEDIPDITIDCVSSAERCNVMMQDPFTACHEHIDPGPYIDACTNISCKYPAVDGLICQYFEAYAMSCALKRDITLGDWRSTVNCATVLQEACFNQQCRYYEFCGEMLGETRCLCRARFKVNLPSGSTFGEQVYCMQNSARVSMYECLLWEKGIDYLTLHLNDPSCTGYIDDEYDKVTFSFNSSNCGTQVMMNNSQIFFKNTIRTRNDSMDNNINRYDEVEIDFSCYYAEPDIQTLSFRIRDSSVVLHIESEVWNYNLIMGVFTNPNFVDLLEPGSEIQLNQRIWLELKTEGLDGNRVVVVTDSCWATDQSSPDVGMHHYLIYDGCPNPADQTVEVNGNGLGTSTSFSFSMFEFNGQNDEIYFHCKVELCPKDLSCAPICGGSRRRRRRSSWSEYAARNNAIITMVWYNQE